MRFPLGGLIFFKKYTKNKVSLQKRNKKNVMLSARTKWFPSSQKADDHRYMSRLLLGRYQFFSPKMTDFCPYSLLRINYTQNEGSLAFAWQEINTELWGTYSHSHLYLNPLFFVLSISLIYKQIYSGWLKKILVTSMSYLFSTCCFWIWCVQITGQFI